MQGDGMGIEELAADAERAWGSSYGRFAAVLADLGLRRGAEIGVAFGGHASSILDTATVERLWAIDPYLHQDDYDDPVNWDQKGFDAMYEFARRQLSEYGPRADLLRMTSAEAAPVVPDGIDFVYIDAIHTCEAVWSDLTLWAPKVRRGGVVGGHDYGHVNFPGVKLAVDTFSHRSGRPILELGETVWYVAIEDLPATLGDAPCASRRRIRDYGSDLWRRLRRP